MVGAAGFEPTMHGPKPCVLPLDDAPTGKYMAEREGFEPSVKYKPHTRLAGAHLQPARSPLLKMNLK